MSQTARKIAPAMQDEDDEANGTPEPTRRSRVRTRSTVPIENDQALIQDAVTGRLMLRPDTSLASPPYVVLRALRNRTGMTQEQVTEAAGLPRTTYRSYESGRFGDRVLPWLFVQQVAPVLVGKGRPAITLDELIAISEVRSVRTLLNSMRNQRMTPQDDRRLVIRYRASPGVFVDIATREKLGLGWSHMQPLPDAPAADQWVVEGDDGEQWIAQDLAEGDTANPGTMAVVAREHKMTGLSTIHVVRLLSLGDRAGTTVNALTLTDQSIVGSLLGVCRGSWKPVKNREM